MLPGTLMPMVDFIWGEDALTDRTLPVIIPCLTSAGVAFRALRLVAAWALLYLLCGVEFLVARYVVADKSLVNDLADTEPPSWPHGDEGVAIFVVATGFCPHICQGCAS